jgi:UDP-N-acetylglucosamine 1-carboxyvinyltransferase
MEPEIVDLAQVLSLMGADVQGAGSQEIIIHGNRALQPFDHEVVADRIELGTFLVAGAMAGDGLVLRNGVARHQAALIDKLREVGARIDVEGDRITVHRAEEPQPVDIHTAPYPGFPTDMQAQLMACLTVARGASAVSETIFENRFMHVAELRRLGANIRVEGGKAFIHGVGALSGTTVMATDLRASACLVLAGLVAEGETVVRRIYHLDRGYEQLSRKLGEVGARVERFAE